jgi:hypothetical protein
VSASSWTGFDDGAQTWVLTASGELVSRPSAGPRFAAVSPVGPVASSAQAISGPRVAPALNEALQTLYKVDQLRSFFETILQKSAVAIDLADLPAGSIGTYSATEARVAVNRALLDEDPRALAVALAHELAHVAQLLDSQVAERDCVRLEVKAFMIQSAIWDFFWPGGPPSRTPLETHLTSIYKVFNESGEPGLYSLVVSTPGYQHECMLWSPAPVSASASGQGSAGNDGLAAAGCTSASTRVLLSFAPYASRSGTGEGTLPYLLQLCTKAATEHGEVGIKCFERGYVEAMRLAVLINAKKQLNYAALQDSFYRTCISAGG